MNIKYKRQSQFELFPGTSRNSSEIGKSSCLIKDLTLSLENIIVLCIIFVMALVLFFSFGVEKGKKVALLSGEQDEGDVVQAAKSAVEEQPVRSIAVEQQEERVVFPVNIPQDILEEGEASFRSPFAKMDEQKKFFTIQVASFKMERNAQREVDRLKGIGHDDTFVLPKGNYSIVCVGKFMQKDEAKRFSSRLKNRYSDCLVRRL